MSESDQTLSELMQQVAAGAITADEAAEKLNKREQDIKATKASSNVHYKVSQKGCVAYYGIRRMPITLYIDELKQVLNSTVGSEFKFCSDFQAFVDKAGDSLVRKK